MSSITQLHNSTKFTTSKNSIFIIGIISVLFSLSFVSSQRPEIVTNPSTVSVVKGATAIFQCKVNNVPALAEHPVQWVKSGLGLGYELGMWPRYSMVGDVSIGEYNLLIENVGLEDGGDYECQVVTTYNNKTSQSRSKKAQLQVLVPPRGPLILNLAPNGEYKVIAGKQQKIPCLAYGGKPAASVEWQKIGSRVSEQDTRISDPSNSLFNTTSLLTLMPRPSDEGTRYTCVVRSAEALNGRELRQTIKLKLMHVPSVQLTMPTSVDEQSDVVAKCTAYAADPPVTKYRWLRNGQEIPDEVDTELRIRTVDRSWRGVEIGCQALNEAGYSDVAQHVLDVEYAPILHNVTDDVIAEIGQTVVLTCSWDAHPPAAVTWLREGREGDELYFGDSYVIRDVTQENSARYICRASSEIGSSQKVVQVQVRGPPVIASRSIQAAQLGKNVDVKCELSTTPGIDKVFWTWKSGIETGTRSSSSARKSSEKSYELRSNESRNSKGVMKYHSLLIPGESTALLRIFDVDEEDLRVEGYTCEVSNNYGTTSMMIELEKAAASPQQSDSNVIAIIGGVIGGIIFVLIVFIGLHCARTQKQQKSTDFEETFSKAIPLSTTEAEMMIGDNSTLNHKLKESQQRAPTADDDLSDDNPRASVSSHGGAVTSSCSTSNEGNPTPTSVHDDGYHTEAGSWNPRHGSMIKPSLPAVGSRLPTISATSNFNAQQEDDRGSLVSDVALNFVPSHQLNDGVTLRSMSAMQQPYGYATTRASYDPVIGYPSATSGPTGRSASVLAERMQSPTPLPASSPSQYYPRDYAPLLPMGEAYPLDRLYGSSQSSLEKYERSSLLGNIPSTAITNGGHPPHHPHGNSASQLVNKNVTLRLNQSSRGSSENNSQVSSNRPRMATHV